MKKHLTAAVIIMTLGVLLITASLVTAQSNEFVVPLSDPAKAGKLKVHINYGSISIKGTARKDVLIKYKSVEDGDSDHDHDCDDCDEKPKSKEGLKKISSGGLDLEASENNNQVRIQSDSWNNKINLEIEVPSAMDISAHTYNDGDLTVSNIQGQLELNNYNGEITAISIAGSVVATTYNGEIKVMFDKVTEGTPMSFSTYNGDIDLTFPAAFKATLKMKTDQGEIYTGFDVEIKSSNPVQKKDTKSGVYRVVVDDWKRADINGGGAEISLKNYNGDIYIRKK